MDYEKAFTTFDGVFIREKIWDSNHLSLNEKLIISVIEQFADNKTFDWSNKEISNFCFIGQTSVSTAINKLCALRYIKIKSFDGRKRVIEVLYKE